VIVVDVAIGALTYPVIVGPDARGMVPTLLPARARRAAIVTQAAVGVEVDPGVEHQVVTLEPGEHAKSLASIESLCAGWARWGLTRGDVVIAVGGGAVTDTAGFAAAVYHRGVALVNVPTTLLAMVDAAIGGKTGVNLPEGKNLVGAFWQPEAVVCDTTTLDTLPERERRSGLGEMAKYHFLTGDDLLALSLDERIAACVRIKAAVVAVDEREAIANDRGRAVLNYGHTLAHALESAGGYDLRHGEAVGIGLVFAATLARRLGRIDDARVAAHRRVVASYDLPISLPAGAEVDDLVERMRRDKKAIDGLTFVLDGPAGVEVVRDIDLHTVTAALEELT
jgi:5-deoxy-5-amino-3-dehydroquinate synthase